MTRYLIVLARSTWDEFPSEFILILYLGKNVKQINERNLVKIAIWVIIYIYITYKYVTIASLISHYVRSRAILHKPIE